MYLPVFPRKLSKRNTANFWTSNQGKFYVCFELDLMSPNPMQNGPENSFSSCLWFFPDLLSISEGVKESSSIHFWKGSVLNPQNDEAEQNAVFLYDFLTFIRVSAYMYTCVYFATLLGPLASWAKQVDFYTSEKPDIKGLQQAMEVHLSRSDCTVGVIGPAWLPRLLQHCFHSASKGWITLKPTNATNSKISIWDLGRFIINPTLSLFNPPFELAVLISRTAKYPNRAHNLSRFLETKSKLKNFCLKTTCNYKQVHRNVRKKLPKIKFPQKSEAVLWLLQSLTIMHLAWFTTVSTLLNWL